MNRPLSDDGGLIIQSATFTEEMIQISYAESREHAKNVGILRTMFLSVEEVVPEVEEVLQLLREIVDRGLLVLRNPPSTTGPPHAPRPRTPDPERIPPS